jgi:uncharacterized protein YjbJ (UPF0337 family)
MNKDHISGKADSLKGSVKSAAGDIRGNHEQKASGTVDKMKGAVKSTLGDVKDKITEVKNEVKNKVDQAKR